MSMLRTHAGLHRSIEKPRAAGLIPVVRRGRRLTPPLADNRRVQSQDSYAPGYRDQTLYPLRQGRQSRTKVLQRTHPSPPRAIPALLASWQTRPRTPFATHLCRTTCVCGSGFAKSLEVGNLANHPHQDGLAVPSDGSPRPGTGAKRIAPRRAVAYTSQPLR